MARVSPIAQVDKKREGGAALFLLFSIALRRPYLSLTVALHKGFRDYGPPQQPRGIIDPRHDTSTRGYILNLFLPPPSPRSSDFERFFLPIGKRSRELSFFPGGYHLLPPRMDPRNLPIRGWNRSLFIPLRIIALRTTNSINYVSRVSRFGITPITGKILVYPRCRKTKERGERGAGKLVNSLRKLNGWARFWNEMEEGDLCASIIDKIDKIDKGRERMEMIIW